mgnify:CR=1 FL=1
MENKEKVQNVSDLVDKMLNNGQVKSEKTTKPVEELPDGSVGKVLVNFLLKEDVSPTKIIFGEKDN